MDHDTPATTPGVPTSSGAAEVRDVRGSGLAGRLEREHSRLRAPTEVRDLAASARLSAATPAAMLGRLAAISVLYLIAASAGLAAETWWVWPMVWAIQSVLLLVCGAAMHEGIHANLTGNRGLDRWIAFSAGWLIFLPAAAYRPYHLQHHATTISAADPSGANARPFRSRRHYLLVMALSGPGFTAQMWSIAVRTLFGRSPEYVPARLRRQMIAETVLALVAYLAIVVLGVLTGGLMVVAAVWVVPAVLGLCLVAPFVLTSEHYGAAEDRPLLESTATVDSNPVLAFVYLNNNHHTAHHLLSSCNPLRLPEVTAVVEDRIELRHSSYTAFHRSVWRSLEW